MSQLPTKETSPPLDSSGRYREISLLTGLGITLIISWGSLYYSIAVLAQPLRRALNLSDLVIFSAFSLGLVASGLAAPFAGRWIDRSGGRTPLAIGSMLAGISFIVLALAQGSLVYFSGWLIAGIAMALCLYDPVFGVLNQLNPRHYRRSITILALFGGFASTVFWPVTHWLESNFGWRETLLVYAGLHFFIATPIHWLVIPKSEKIVSSITPPKQTPTSPSIKSASIFRWLAIAFCFATMVFAALSVYLIDALESRGFDRNNAVLLAACVGPMQVAGRLIEWRFGQHITAVIVGKLALAMLFIALLLLNLMPAWWGIALLFVALYGCANGVITIARGAIVVEIFGSDHLGETLGQLARPVFIALALTPAGFAGLLNAGMSFSLALWFLVPIAGLSVMSYWRALRLLDQTRRQQRQVQRGGHVR